MEGKLSSSLFLSGGGFFGNHVTVSGCLWGSWHQSLKWSTVCQDKLEPFIDEVYGKHQIRILFLPGPCTCSLYALPTRALFDELFMSYEHQEAKPPTYPQTPPSGRFWGNPKRVGLQGMLRSPNWAPAHAQDDLEVPLWHGLRARPSMSEPTQARHPWSSRGLTLRPFGIFFFFKKYFIKVLRTICIASQHYKQTQALNTFVIS